LRLVASGDFRRNHGNTERNPFDVNDDQHSSGDIRRAAKHRAVQTRLQDLLELFRQAKRARDRQPKSGAGGDALPDGEHLSMP